MCWFDISDDLCDSCFGQRWIETRIKALLFRCVIWISETQHNKFVRIYVNSPMNMNKWTLFFCCSRFCCMFSFSLFFSLLRNSRHRLSGECVYCALHCIYAPCAFANPFIKRLEKKKYERTMFVINSSDCDTTETPHKFLRAQ